MKRLHVLLALCILCAACAPAGGQPKFSVRALPSATSIPLPKSPPAAIALHQRITSFDASPDSKLLAIGFTGDVRLYDLDENRLLRWLPAPAGWVTTVAWSPDGSKLAVGGSKDYGTPFYVGGDSTNSWKAHLTIFDASTWKVVLEPEFGNDMVNQMFYDIAWSPDGRSLAFSTDLGGVEVIDVQTGQVISRQVDFAGTVTAISWSPDGSRLLANHDIAYGMRRWRVSDGQAVRLFDPRSSNFMSIAWSADGARIASGDGQGGLCFWTAATNKCDGFVHAHRTATFSLAWSPDGNQLATGGGVIRIWDTHTGALIRSFGEDSSFVYEKIEWLKQGGKLAAFGMSITGSPASIVRLWDISTGALLSEFRGQ